MTKFKSANIIQSITNAVHGLKLAFFSQRNFAFEVIFSIFVISFALILKFKLTDFCIVLILIALVLICELLNSVIEFTIDAVYKNNYSKLAEMAKDIAAGMVLLSAFFSLIAGLILFGSYIIF